MLNDHAVANGFRKIAIRNRIGGRCGAAGGRGAVAARSLEDERASATEGSARASAEAVRERFRCGIG
ncbi:hypothetical protein D3261_10960 [Halococcus sp. IIIV-5B]|nr:hypothetical protein D3261_10960 [Halococcus sp. IIIV-5B]